MQKFLQVSGHLSICTKERWTASRKRYLFGHFTSHECTRSPTDVKLAATVRLKHRSTTVVPRRKRSADRVAYHVTIPLRADTLEATTVERDRDSIRQYMYTVHERNYQRRANRSSLPRRRHLVEVGPDSRPTRPETHHRRSRRVMRLDVGTSGRCGAGGRRPARGLCRWADGCAGCSGGAIRRQTQAVVDLDLGVGTGSDVVGWSPRAVNWPSLIG